MPNCYAIARGLRPRQNRGLLYNRLWCMCGRAHGQRCAWPRTAPAHTVASLASIVPGVEVVKAGLLIVVIAPIAEGPTRYTPFGVEQDGVRTFVLYFVIIEEIQSGKMVENQGFAGDGGVILSGERKSARCGRQSGKESKDVVKDSKGGKVSQLVLAHGNA